MSSDFTANGIILQSGRVLPADVIVAATGYALARALARISVLSHSSCRLQLNQLGDVIFSIGGRRVDFAEKIMYKGTMFSGMPNLAISFGYVNASW